jgi:hypothetical protein
MGLLWPIGARAVLACPCRRDDVAQALSLTARLFPTRSTAARARSALERQHRRPRRRSRRGHRGRLRRVYGELRALETIDPGLGYCRRPGGAQFARRCGGAVPRAPHRRRGRALAAPPAQPHGAALPWPRRAGARQLQCRRTSCSGGKRRSVSEAAARCAPLREPDEAAPPALTALADWVRGPASASPSSGSTAARRRDRGDADARRGGFLAPRRAVLRP